MGNQSIPAACRRESNRTLDRATRYKLIESALEEMGNGTAREIANHLHFSERNAAAPRLTELVKLGRVVVIGKRKCKVTGKACTVYELA